MCYASCFGVRDVEVNLTCMESVLWSKVVGQLGDEEETRLRVAEPKVLPENPAIKRHSKQG
jgi:hypothetical protein